MTIKKPNKRILKDFKNRLLKYKLDNNVYSTFAKYYDLIMNNIDYYSWYKYLIDICKNNNVCISKILDIACGTGNTLKYFVDRKYDCYGLDLSKPMLEIAKTKMRNSSNVRFIHGDMTKYKPDSLFNLVYSFNDSINYLPDRKMLTDFLYTAFDLLEAGGILVFDVSTEFNIIQNFSKPIYEEYKDFAFLWNNTYSKETKIVLSELDFLIYDTLEVIKEKHIQRIYSIKEIKREATAIGFSNIEVFNEFTFKKPYKKSEIIHFVMKK